MHLFLLLAPIHEYSFCTLLDSYFPFSFFFCNRVGRSCVFSLGFYLFEIYLAPLVYGLIGRGGPKGRPGSAVDKALEDEEEEPPKEKKKKKGRVPGRWLGGSQATES